MTPTRTRWLAAGVAGLVVAVALARLAAFGWAALAPDDARYLFVGMSLLDGQGAITPSGDPYLLRAPVYGIALAAGSRLTGADPVTGAHLVAALIGTMALVGAAGLAWRLHGPVAAAVTSLALLATPLPWTLLPTLRVDQSLGFLVIAALLVAGGERPGYRRAALTGAMVGLAVLVKEAALPLALLPVAWIGRDRLRRWPLLAAAFLVAVVAVAAWWWLVVWMEGHVLFPLNALGVIEARQVGTGGRLARGDLVMAAVGAVAWVVVVVRARADRTLRPLVVAFVALLPAAAYAVASGLAARNYLPLELLSAVAIGIAVPVVAARGAAQAARLRPSIRRAGGVAAVVVATGGIVAAQLLVARPVSDPLPERIAAAVSQRVAAGGAVAMTFRERETTAIALFGRVPVVALDPGRVARDDDPADYLWMGLRDEQLFGFRRARWAAILGREGVSLLVVVEPHPLSPLTLLPALDGSLSVDPATRAVDVIEAGGTAHLYAVRPDALSAAVSSTPLHLDGRAAVAWLAYGDDALARLAAARPVVAPSDGLEALRAALRNRACLVDAGPDAPAGWLRLQPAGAGC